MWMDEEISVIFVLYASLAVRTLSQIIVQSQQQHSLEYMSNVTSAQMRFPTIYNLETAVDPTAARAGDLTTPTTP